MIEEFDKSELSDIEGMQTLTYPSTMPPPFEVKLEPYKAPSSLYIHPREAEDLRKKTQRLPRGFENPDFYRKLVTKDKTRHEKLLKQLIHIGRELRNARTIQRSILAEKYLSPADKLRLISWTEKIAELKKKSQQIREKVMDEETNKAPYPPPPIEKVYREIHRKAKYSHLNK